MKNKPIALQTRVMTKEERQLRERNEARLRGKSDKLRPPTNLTKGAKKYFKKIVSTLQEVDILGNGDIDIISITAMTRDRIDQVETLIQVTNDVGDLEKLMRLQSTLNKDLRTYLVELGLTPSSRSKMAQQQGEKKDKEVDPLLIALKKIGG